MFRYAYIFILLSILSVKSFASNGEKGWWHIESEHFNFYFQDSSTWLATSIIPAATNTLTTIEEKIGYRLSGKIQIYLHRNSRPSIPMRDATRDIGGVTYIKNNSVHVYLDGNYENLMQQIALGISDNLITEMLFGGTVQERIRYAALMHLPPWFHQGLIRYLALGWDLESDNLMRDAFNNVQFKSFSDLSREEQILVGNSMWMYIDETGDKDEIKRILYLVRLTRKVETAMYFVLNKTTKHLYVEWYNNTITIYAHELKRRIPMSPEFRGLDATTTHLVATALSPSANSIAYAITEEGKLTVNVYDRTTFTTNTIYQKRLNTDLGRHGKDILLRWQTDSTLLAIQNYPEPSIYTLHARTGEIEALEALPSLDYVSSFDYYPAEDLICLAGHTSGQSNLYLFRFLTAELIPLTKSIHEDSEPNFDFNGNVYFTRVVFNDDELRYMSGWQKDIFFLFRSGIKVIGINNVTQSKHVNEETPLKLSSQYLSYLSDQNGIRNAYAFRLDSQAFALSNYQTGILDQCINTHRTHILEVVRHNGYLFTYISEIDSNQDFGAILQPSKTKVLIKQNTQIIKSDSIASVRNAHLLSDSLEPIYFQSDFKLPDNIDSLDLLEQETKSDYEIVFSNQVTELNLNPSRLFSQVNNEVFPTQNIALDYHPEEQLLNKFGVVVGIGITDQFKEHDLEGKFRMTFNFDRYQYRIAYKHQGAKYNQFVQFNAENRRFNQNILDDKRLHRSIEYGLSRKLNPAQTVQLVQEIRQDKLVYVLKEWPSTGPEFTALNSLSTACKWMYNTLYTNDMDNYVGLKIQAQTKWRYNLSNGKSGLISEAHALYGKRLWKNVIWNSRMHIGNSAGLEQTLFLLGGQTNQFGPNLNDDRFNYTNISYVRPVYGIRNTSLNARTGTTYGFVNSNIYFPFSKLIGRKPIKTAALQNLWIYGFTDVGTAWTGVTPRDRRNASNIELIQSGRLDIQLYNVKYPIIWTPGFGAKTRLWGYLVRLDYGWHFDNFTWSQARTRLSLGRSF